MSSDVIWNVRLGVVITVLLAASFYLAATGF